MLADNNGNPEEGAVQAGAQGQLVDTNGHGILDGLGARGALPEDHDVIAVRIYDLTLRRSVGGVWQTASQNLADAASSAEPAKAVSLYGARTSLRY
jgi:hypothetical protein